jgi:hypothetical protein
MRRRRLRRTVVVVGRVAVSFSAVVVMIESLSMVQGLALLLGK